ncbi:hypothetical protein BXY_24300 [Bacteroides xylanisolvens XB1A]|uniref:Uncharacterized protein n=1 Tax=Bacteroides xylanisolvens XB1A TaxID=657309 RepID=D6CZ91_9BACE|nr:hypothetical protein BXY_24300 [Bacteroides xylanisolvens XB1A]
MGVISADNKGKSFFFADVNDNRAFHSGCKIGSASVK